MTNDKYSAEAMLEQCRGAAVNTRIADEQIERLQSMLERVTTSLSYAPGRGERHDIAERLAEIDDIKQSTATALFLLETSIPAAFMKSLPFRICNGQMPSYPLPILSVC